MNAARAVGFAKEAGFKDWAGIGLGALGAGLGAAGAVMAHRTRGDVDVMRQQSRAADTLHSAMLYETRTGQRISPAMRQQIGVGYMRANQAYRNRFGQAHKVEESDENDEK